MTRYADDLTLRADQVAGEMRDYYEANRPLRWWEKRNPPDSWGCIADNLMLGLRNIVLDAERAHLMDPAPIPMILICPSCGARHIDVGPFATKVHHTHACQHCGMVWRPAIVPTVGVRFLPGFKNEQPR